MSARQKSSFPTLEINVKFTAFSAPSALKFTTPRTGRKQRFLATDYEVNC